MDTHFLETHKQFFKGTLPAGAQPDTGNGYYCRELSYKDWFFFNTVYRAHIHILEWLPYNLMCLIVGGLKLPIAAAVSCFVYTIGRIIMTISVFKCPKGRPVGGIIQEIALIANFIITVWSIVEIFV